MYATERQQRILAEARRDGRAEVSALAETLGVTSETIRRDLTALERRGVVRRVHGGAIPTERLEIEPALTTRAQMRADVKRRIASRVLEELPAEGTVILDAGSTTQSIVDILPRDSQLTVITNSLPIASALSAFPHVTLLVLGGRIRGVTGACVGDWCTSALDGLVVDVSVIGTNGISAERGLTTPDHEEALAKSAMVRAARKTIVATDSTKAGDDHLHRFASLDHVDLVITDGEMAADVAEEIRAAGPQVVTA